MSNNSVELGKMRAAHKAVQDNIKNGMVLGIGSGTTVVYAVNKISEIVNEKSLIISCIPSSFQSYQLIIENDLPLATLDRNPEIDLAIDGADEIDKDLNLIKGGGGCLLQEKIIATNSKDYIVIADFRKLSGNLGEKWKLPIEILPMAYKPISIKILKLGGSPILRIAKAKSGPVITDNGNWIIDVDFGIIKDPYKLENELNRISGILETGLFLKMTTKAYIGQEDGEVRILTN